MAPGSTPSMSTRHHVHPRPRWLRLLEHPWIAAGVLALLACSVLLPGLETIPVVDRDEARFAQASRQMLESGTLEGWTIPRVGERTRLSKPPLVYWLQAGGTGLLTSWDASRDAIWMYRIPGVLCAIGTVLVTWRIGVAMFGGLTGFLAGCMIAVCPLLVFDAHMARADQLLVLLTTAAMGMLFLCWKHTRRTDRRLPIRLTSMLWILVGLGALAKGPITPMVVVLGALSLAAWSGRWKWVLRLRPFTGILVALAVFLPWVLLASRAVGFGTLWEIFYDEVVVRSSTGRESHGAPPGYHLVLLTVLLWPGSLLTGLALGRSWRRAGRPVRRYPASSLRPEAFCLAWIIPNWLVFELAATKLPHYTLPLYPALALISARAVMAGSRALPQVTSRGARLGFTLWLLIGTGICALPLVLLALGYRGGPLGSVPPGSPLANGPAWPEFTLLGAGSLLGLAFLVAGYRLVLKGRLFEGQLVSIPTAALSMTLVFGVTLPLLWPIWITPRLDHVIDAATDGSGPPALAATGYTEDSLMFSSRGRLERIPDSEVRDWAERHPGGIIVLQRDQVPEGGRFTELGEVGGFNYSKGSWMDLVVLRSDGPARAP